MRRGQELLMASLMLGGGFPVPNDVKEVDQELQYEAEILAEYELIKLKQSRFSRNKRDIIESKALRILAKRDRAKYRQAKTS